MVTAGEDSTVRLWSLQGQHLVLFQRHTDMIKRVSFSPMVNDWPPQVEIKRMNRSKL